MTVTGIIIAAAAVASADAAPSLPARTPGQLLTDVAQASAKPLGPLTATVQETSDLGLPSLPASLQQAGGPASLATGPESVSIWYRDPQHIRVAEPVQAGETDLRLDGRTLWTWNSKTQTATRYALPAHVSGLPAHAGNGATRRLSPQAGLGSPGSSIPDTPQAAAAQVLKAVGPTTVVGVQRNVYVAGRPAYQLSLVPRSSKSLVGSVLIAIDATRHIPLRVEVYARSSDALAYSIGFASLSFGAPAMSNFTFTPPPGATVRHVTVPSDLQAALRQAGLGSGGLNGLAPAGIPAKASVPLVAAGKAGIVRHGSLPALPKQALTAIKAQFARSLPKSMSAAQRARVIKAFDRQFRSGRPSGSYAYAPITAQAAANLGNNGGGFFSTGATPTTAAAQAGAPRVIGTSWLSVVATPPSPQVASAVRQALSPSAGALQLQPGSATTSTLSSSASSGADSSALTVSPPAGPDIVVLQALLKAATPVHGSWGSGRLLHTTLLSVLVTSRGQILAGAVSPSVLYADVAADAG